MQLRHCYPTMDAPAIGRVAALDAGLPVTASGLQIDRRCGSGLQAVINAAMQVHSGASDVVLAGGAESMSNVPLYSTARRWGVKASPVTCCTQSYSECMTTALRTIMSPRSPEAAPFAQRLGLVAPPCDVGSARWPGSHLA